MSNLHPEELEGCLNTIWTSEPGPRNLANAQNKNPNKNIAFVRVQWSSLKEDRLRLLAGNPTESTPLCRPRRSCCFVILVKTWDGSVSNRSCSNTHSSLFRFFNDFAFSIEGAGLRLSRIELPPDDELEEASAAAA